MSDTILSSLDSSSLQRSINQISKSDPFEYMLSDSTPAVASENLRVAPESSVKSAGGQKVSIRLPSAGFLSDGAIVVSNTVAGAAGATNELKTASIGKALNGAGLYFYDDVVLKSKDQELLRVFPMWLHWQALNSRDAEKYIRASNLDMPGMGVAALGGANGLRDSILPLGLLPFSKTPKDSLDLKFLENMYLDLNVRKVSDVSAGWVDAEINDIDAHLKYYNMNAEDYAMYLRNNYDQSKSLSKLMVSNYQENVTTIFTANPGAGVKSFTMSLDCPHYVVATYIGVRATGGTVAMEHGGGNTYLPVTDVVIRGNGKTLYTTNGNARAVGLGFASKEGSSRTKETTGENNVNAYSKGDKGPHEIFKIDWTLVNNQHSSPDTVDHLEGGVSMSAVSGKEISIKYLNTNDAYEDVEFEVVHEVVQVIEINAKNGTVNVSTRS
jgi:hypothetical protein